MKICSKRAIKRIAIGLGLLIGAALVVNGILAWRAQHRMDVIVAELRAAGEPASLGELAPNPIPPGNNPAAYLEQMRQELKAYDKQLGVFEGTPLGEGWNKARTDTYELPDAEQAKAMRAILDAYPAILPRLAQASACSDYASLADFSLPPSKLSEQMLNQINPVRELMNFVDCQMRTLAAEGKPDAAVRLGIQMLQFMKLWREPFTLNYFLSVAAQDATFEALNLAVRQESVSPQVRSELEKELTTFDNCELLQFALTTDRAFAISKIGEQTERVPIFLRWIARTWQLKWLDVYDQAFYAAKMPLDQIRPRWDTAAKREQLPLALDKSQSDKLLGPVIAMVFDGQFRLLAKLRCLQVLNALAEYKQRTGKDAESIDQLSLPHDATIDPYSGKPLLLKKTDQGWVVYSVWRNNVDDGGRFNYENGDWGLGPPGYPHEHDWK